MAHRLQSDSIVKHPEMQPTQILPRAERQKNLMALTKREELSSFGRQATPAPSRSRHCDEEGESPEIRATKRISQNNNATMCRHSSGPKQQTRRQLGIPEATSKERKNVCQSLSMGWWWWDVVECWAWCQRKWGIVSDQSRSRGRQKGRMYQPMSKLSSLKQSGFCNIAELP